MFLSEKAINKSYEQLIKLDSQHGGTGKSRKEKVSGLRYLLATSLMLKTIASGQQGATIQSVNLAVGSADRKAFIKAVGEIVSIDNTSKYTADFAGEFADADDFAVGSNFLTTVVAGSRDGRSTPYPKRPEPLLDILDEKMSIKSNVKDILEKKYNLNEIKVPLTMWLLRSADIQGVPPADSDELRSTFAKAITSKFDPLVSAAITPTKDEWEIFLKASGLDLLSMFVSSVPNHASVMALHSTMTTGGHALTNIQDIASKAYLDFRASNLILRQDLTLRFIASMLTKRFVILTGLSGSGKTKLAEAFAAWISESKDQYRLVAVGADWTTNENVVGYPDALQDGIYRKPSNGALDLILRADSDRDNPYFLILDEMNLSHVERYFADILSAIESSGHEIALHSSAEELKASDGNPVPREICLPNNLFIIGTVNVDETTYMFSPKVLDRANVLEFRAAADDIAAFLDAPSAVNMDALAGKGVEFGLTFVTEAGANVQLDSVITVNLKARLTEIFSALALIGAEFGFRTAFEIARFTYFHEKLSDNGWQFNDALDAQVLQKLIPKLHGSERKLGPTLVTLAEFCEKHGCDLSLEKIKRMQSRLRTDGFTSSAEA